MSEPTTVSKEIPLYVDIFLAIILGCVITLVVFVQLDHNKIETQISACSKPIN